MSLSTEDPKIVKAKTRKGKRILEKRAPKLVEDEKNVLLLHGTKVSETVKNVLTDLATLKRGHAVRYNRKNEVRPFESGHEGKLQYFCERSDCALFCLGSHSKKRPNNLVLGRLHDNQILDMIEFGVEGYRAIQDFPGGSHVAALSKPCFAFIGSSFQSDARFKAVQSMLLDCLGGQVLGTINLMDVSRIVVCIARDSEHLAIRQYAILLKRSGSRVPRIELEEVGPHLDMAVRRVQEAHSDAMRAATTQPAASKPKQKNVETTSLDGKVGRVFVPLQNLSNVVQAKGKGLKRSRRDAASERKRMRQSAPVVDGEHAK